MVSVAPPIPHRTMEATAAYPQWPPVLVSTGLGGAIAAPSPDRIPLQPVMVSDPRERARSGGVDCVGVLRECHRNLAGYAYARPLKRVQYRGENHSGELAMIEAKYFARHNREFVPRDMVFAWLQDEIVRERESGVPKWQGNALLGLELPASRDHAVFFPTGQILQQARVFRSLSRDRKRHRLSNGVECGAVVRQFELLGSRDTYEMYGASSVYAAARGAANCTILEASFGGDDDKDTLKAVHRLRFDEMLYHIAGSPHTESEMAFVTGDGKVHTWAPASGAQPVRMPTASLDERLLRCEYASHPCVLWTSNRVRVQTLDLRESQSKTTSVSLFDLVEMNAPNSEIYALKRRERSPFQLVIGTSVSIELLDSRMPGRALLSWQQRHEMDSKQPLFGMVDEIRWESGSTSDTGMVLSSTQGRKTVSLYPFVRHDGTSPSARSSPFLSITPLRSASDEPQRAISQYVASDSPLDLQLRDGSEWTTLSGLCALTDDSDTASANVYQLSSMGDLFCQQIRPSTSDEMYETAVQVDLPCGVTAQRDLTDEEGTRLPIPADALEEEHASDALTPFVALPVKAFIDQFPRLPDVSGTDDQSAIQSRETITVLRRVCRPSATLFRLHRYVNETLKLRVSSQSLLRVLRSHAEFRVRSVHHRFRQRVATVLEPYPSPFPSLEARASRDDRLQTCSCCPQTAFEPCESVACIVPHALIVTSASDIHSEPCFPTVQDHTDTATDDFAAMLRQARAAYGQRT